MSITFCIESRSEREDRALESEGAPVLNVHNAGGFILLDHLGYELDHYGAADAANLIARTDLRSERPLTGQPNCGTNSAVSPTTGGPRTSRAADGRC